MDKLFLIGWTKSFIKKYIEKALDKVVHYVFYIFSIRKYIKDAEIYMSLLSEKNKINEREHDE